MREPIEVTIKETEPLTVAFLAKTGPFSEIGPAFGVLYAWIGRKGLIPSGPPQGVYFTGPCDAPSDQMRWELLSPVAGNPTPEGPDEAGLGVKTLNSTLVASTVHRGSFDHLQKTYTALAEWIASNGYIIDGPSSEVYLTDPNETRPEDLLTEIRFEVRRAG